MWVLDVVLIARVYIALSEKFSPSDDTESARLRCKYYSVVLVLKSLSMDTWWPHERYDGG